MLAGKTSRQEVLALSSATTTGWIRAGSRTLHLEDNPGFAVGDQLIVELGGEAGRGLRGTVGVGGTWPRRSYGSYLDLLASPQAEGQYAWVHATGDVYQYAARGWRAVPESSFYIAKAIPLSLIARVEYIRGNVITLSKLAAADSQAANIYLDNSPALACSFQGLGDVTYVVPNGRFAISAPIRIAGTSNISLCGSGTECTAFFSPRGVPSASIQCYETYDAGFYDFTIEGNARSEGFGLQTFAAGAPVVTESLVPQGTAYPGGLAFGLTNRAVARNLRVVDVFQKAISASFSTDVWAFDCVCELSGPLHTYVQWLFQWSDSSGGGCVDCVVKSPFLVAGFEIFRSEGVQFVRPRSLNGTVAVNSSGSFLLDGCDLLVEAGSQYGENSFSKHNPVIDVNMNIAPPHPASASGGIIRNPRIVQNGPINSVGDILTSITIAAPNVRVEGGYPDEIIRGGYISHPTGLKHSATGVHSTATNTIVEGIRVLGRNDRSEWGNIYVGRTGCVRKCIADVISGEGSREGNRTNVDYEKQLTGMDQR